LGLSADKPLTGTFKVVSSRIRYAGISWAVWAVRNAQITIGGSPSDGNVVEDGQVAGEFMDLDHSVFEYSYNNAHVAVNPWGGLFIWQGAVFLPQRPTQFLIQHNTFKTSGNYANGVWLVDFGPPNGQGKTGNFVIADNTFVIEPSEGVPAYAGIQTDFTEGTIISNNRIVGSGLYGIVLEGDTHAMVLLNDVEHVTADVAPIGLTVNEWFYPNLFPTSNCIVIGSPKTNVLDQGVNNILVGVHKM
jgi:hypothetical protein